MTSSKVFCIALKIILPSPQPGLYSIPGSNCIRTKTCEIQNCIITDKPQIKGPLQTPSQIPLRTSYEIILGLWGEDWSHWEGLWSHISCPVRLVPHCCLGTCKQNIQITVEHIFKLLRFCLTLNYLNHFKECCSWNLFKYAEVKITLLLFNGFFLQYFELLWQETQFESIVQMCKKTVFASIDKIC